MTTDTEALAAQAEQAMRCATRLRALAAVIEANPDVKLPFDVSFSAGSTEAIDRWAKALRDAGHDYEDVTDAHRRELRCGAVGLWLHLPHDESMRRYQAGLRFLAEHAAEVDALAATCPDCGRALHDDDPSNTGLGRHVDCTRDGALAGQSA